jgi:hypothetical protein
MKVGVIWRPVPRMVDAFGRAQQWWEGNGVDTVLVDNLDSWEWNPAAARNEAMRRLQGDRLEPVVICDADTHPERIDELMIAIELCRKDPYTIHQPYTEFHLTDPVTGEVVGTYNESTGGIYVATPHIWWGLGGQDEFFSEWSPEDTAFSYTHQTILGREFSRVPGVLIGYDHPSNPLKSEETALTLPRFLRYVAARGDVEAMRELTGATL